MSLVDTAVLGHGKVEDLAGAALGRNIGFAVQSISMGVVLASEPLTAQAIGARDEEKAYGAFRTTLRACRILWFPTAMIVAAFTYVLRPLGIDPSAVETARAFLWTFTPSLYFTSIFLAGKTYLQAHGRTTPALVGTILANLWNWWACNALVRGDEFLARFHLPTQGFEGFGSAGAGLATTSASIVLALCTWVPARRLRPAHPEAFPLKRLLRLGLPVAAQLLAEIGVFSAAALLAGRLGTIAVSAHQIALGLASFTFMAALGVSGATAVRVGHAVGAGESPRLIGLLGFSVGTLVMIVGMIAFAFFPHALAGIFTEDPQVLQLGTRLLVIASFFQLFDGMQAVGAGALRGAGDIRFPFLANLVAHWGVGLPVALYLAFRTPLGVAGLWWGLTAGLVLTALLLIARFWVLTRRPIARL
jgi:MATE family multidrug resistance protein